MPTLADLLAPPETRPTKFWRACDLFDAERVGFVSMGPDAERAGSLLDVSRPGNRNAGYTYGTALSPREKRALVEYLKTR